MTDRLNGYTESLKIAMAAMEKLEEELENKEEAMSDVQKIIVKSILINGISTGWHKCLENLEEVLGVFVE